jgi:hypothetical protein
LKFIESEKGLHQRLHDRRPVMCHVVRDLACEPVDIDFGSQSELDEVAVGIIRATLEGGVPNFV